MGSVASIVYCAVCAWRLWQQMHGVCGRKCTRWLEGFGWWSCLFVAEAFMTFLLATWDYWPGAAESKDLQVLLIRNCEQVHSVNAAV
jgi:hypothetical protein